MDVNVFTYGKYQSDLPMSVKSEASRSTIFLQEAFMSIVTNSDREMMSFGLNFLLGAISPIASDFWRYGMMKSSDGTSANPTARCASSGRENVLTMNIKASLRVRLFSGRKVPSSNHLVMPSSKSFLVGA